MTPNELEQRLAQRADLLMLVRAFGEGVELKNADAKFVANWLEEQPSPRYEQLEKRLARAVGLPTEEEKRTQAMVGSAQAARDSARLAEHAVKTAKSYTRAARVAAVAAIVAAAVTVVTALVG